MELRVLRYFVETARQESITRAAKTLHISQPTLSRQLRDLEDELGVTLFQRTNYAIRLTEEGIRFRLRAEDILAMADQALEEFSGKNDTIAGDIRIGAAEAESVRLFGRTMRTLYETWPDIRCHLYSGDTEMLKEKLDSGYLDFLLIAEEPDLVRYQGIPMSLPDQWGLIMNENDPLAQKEAVERTDLFNLPLIVSRQALHQDLTNLFGSDAHRMNIAADYDLAHNASLLVQEGFGYLLTFNHIADLSAETHLVWRPITPKLFTRSHLIWRKYQIFSPACEVFMETLRNLMEEES